MSFWRKSAEMEPPPVDLAAEANAYAEPTVDRAIKASESWTVDLRSLGGWRWLRALVVEAYCAGARSRDR